MKKFLVYARKASFKCRLFCNLLQTQVVVQLRHFMVQDDNYLDSLKTFQSPAENSVTAPHSLLEAVAFSHF